MRRALLALCLLAAVPVPARADDPDGDGLRLVKVGDFSIPVHATAPPGDPHRLMVVEQGADGSTTARIRVVRDGNLLDDSFLDLTGVSHRALEQGLLSMVFAPDYATSGRFYVSYTDDGACTTDACDLAVDEYTRSDDDHADATSRRRVLTVPHQSFRSHYGAMLATGPDGRVYLSTGDSGSAVTGDPDCNSQHSDRLQGKLLRLDPLGASAEVVSLGLRNPYRFAFDRMTGDFVVGDVGQSQEEEIDFVPAGGLAGANFGWNVFEGNAAFADRCASAPLAGYVAPGITYSHAGRNLAAVTGGVVVRDDTMGALRGHYLYADFYEGVIHRALVGAGGASDDVLTGLQVDQLDAFGEDALCHVYVASRKGPVYRLEATTPEGTARCQPPPVTASGPGPAPSGGGTPVTDAPRTPDGPLPDRVAPVLRRVVVVPRRVRAERAWTSVWYSLLERADVTLRLYHRVRSRPHFRLLATAVRRRVSAGRRSIRVGGGLAPGAYELTLRARDAAGNVSSGGSAGLAVLP